VRALGKGARAGLFLEGLTRQGCRPRAGKKPLALGRRVCGATAWRFQIVKARSLLGSAAQKNYGGAFFFFRQKGQNDIGQQGLRGITVTAAMVLAYHPKPNGGATAAFSGRQARLAAVREVGGTPMDGQLLRFLIVNFRRRA